MTDARLRTNKISRRLAPAANGCPDVMARSLRVQVGAGNIQADADQFYELRGQNPVGPGIRRYFHGLLRPGGIPFPQMSWVSLTWPVFLSPASI